MLSSSCWGSQAQQASKGKSKAHASLMALLKHMQGYLIGCGASSAGEEVCKVDSIEAVIG
jgi:hypothetical protein